MQPVRKKQKLTYKARAAVLAAIVLVLVGVTVFIILNRPRTSPPLLKSEDTSHVLIDRPGETLQSFLVTNSMGDQFTIKKEGEQFILDGHPGFLLDRHQVDLMVKDLTLLITSDWAGDVPEDDESLEMLGLGKNASRVTAHYADGTEITVRFGFDARTEIPSDFIMVEGDSKVYTISQETRDHFDRDISTLHQIPAINFSSKLVNQIRFEGENAFTLRQTDGWWEMTAPYPHAVNVAALTSLLSNINKMRFALYVSDARESNLADFGLDSLKRSVYFDLSASTITEYDKQDNPISNRDIPAQTLRIDLGDDYEQIGLYCLYDGKVYLCSNASMGFLRDVSFETLKSKSPLNIPINRLQSLMVEENHVRTRYTIGFVETILPNNELAKDKDGNQLFDTLVYIDDKEIDSQVFLRAYLNLLGLYGAGPLPETYKANEHDWVRKYTFVLLDESTRELALFPFDALHYAMRVNGVFVAFVSHEAADAVVFSSNQ